MDEYEALARIDQLPEGALLAVVTSAGERLVLANDGSAIRAVQALCPHQEFPLADGSVLPGGRIECAWHGAQYDLRTGKPLHHPAEHTLVTYRVAVRDGMILVGPRA